MTRAETRRRTRSGPILLLIVLVSMGLGLNPTIAQALCPDFGLPSGSEIVELETNRGTICLELLRAEAPTTAWNFVNYVVRGDYDGTIIHRSVPGFVIQGGAFATTVDSLDPIRTDEAIQNEPCSPDAGTGVCATRSNLRGTVAMARIGGQIDSATNQYFINLADNSSLDSVDEGFSVFARVLGNGMLVADDVAALPIGASDESWWIAPALGSVLSALPLQNPVPLFPTAFGCWNPLDLAVVVSPLSHTQGLPDPFFGTSFYPLSGACGVQIPRFSFVEDPGPPTCPDSDLLTTGVSGMASPQIRLDPATSDFLQYEFPCQQTAEAVLQRDLWRDDLGARTVPELVLVQSAAYQTVPEPVPAAALSAGVIHAVMFARRRRPPV